MSQQKHVPERTCIATRVKKPKKDLLRIVVNPDSGKLEVDLKGKIRSRGANLDTTIEAFELMVKKNLLRHFLKLDTNPTKEEYDELRTQFLAAIEERKFREGNKPVKIRVTKEAFEKIA
jgi:predicted RNA-binding protein YlxR (DUF448 family)